MKKLVYKLYTGHFDFMHPEVAEIYCSLRLLDDGGKEMHGCIVILKGEKHDFDYWENYFRNELPHAATGFLQDFTERVVASTYMEDATKMMRLIYAYENEIWHSAVQDALQELQREFVKLEEKKEALLSAYSHFSNLIKEEQDAKTEGGQAFGHTEGTVIHSEKTPDAQEGQREIPPEADEKGDTQ